MSEKNKKIPKGTTQTRTKRVPKNYSALIESFDDLEGFRNIADSQKGLPLISRDVQLDAAFLMYLKNGFAKRLIDILVEFIIGDNIFNVDFSYKDAEIPANVKKELQQQIEEFNTSNKFVIKFKKFITDLFLNGMLINPVAVNEFNGKVKIGFCDPKQLQKVETDPYDITEVTKIIFKSTFTGEKKELLVIRKIKESVETPEMLNGETFYFAVNNVSNQPEGISELFANLPEIDNLRDLIFNVSDAVNLANFFVLDVELQGATGEKIKQWKKENPLPKKPSRFIHNEKVKQTAVTPGIKPIDNNETVKGLRNYILGNYGYPAHWFSDGTSATRSTAYEQNSPVLKKLKNKQEIIVDVLEQIYTFVIHKAVQRKEGFSLTSKDVERLKLTITPPELDIKDYQAIGTLLDKVVTALDKAEAKSWITGTTARKIFLNQIQSIGYKFDMEAELNILEKQDKEKAKEVPKKEETIIENPEEKKPEEKISENLDEENQ